MIGIASNTILSAKSLMHNLMNKLYYFNENSAYTVHLEIGSYGYIKNIRLVEDDSILPTIRSMFPEVRSGVVRAKYNGLHYFADYMIHLVAGQRGQSYRLFKSVDDKDAPGFKSWVELKKLPVELH